MEIDKAKKTIYQILLPINLNFPLDYYAQEQLEVGDFALVNFRGKEITGIVIKLLKQSAIAHNKIKTINRKLALPKLTKDNLKFIEFLARYNLINHGAVLKMMLSPKEVFDFQREEIFYQLDKIANIRNNQKRTKLINFLENAGAAKLSELEEASEMSRPAIKNLVKQEILKTKIKISKKEIFDHNYQYQEVELSDSQKQAADFFAGKINANKFSCSLLNGVTGSGKTEIYFKNIAQILAKKEGQILILLPEILLTKQFLNKFAERFGVVPYRWHSSTNNKEKQIIWQGVLQNKIRLVVGARSALFLPFADLKLIIIDEEHDGSYKQEDNGVYHARDMAVARAHKANCPIMLVSATPSLETRVNIINGKFDEIKISERFGASKLPKVELIDMRKNVLEKQSWLSSPLKQEMSARLAKGEQCLLFLNRRGYAPLVLCKSCGHRYKCHNCDAWMVEHRSKEKLICHHCLHYLAKPDKCLKCDASESLVSCGPGVERIAEEVELNFPDFKNTVITSDLMQNETKMQQAINSIANGEIDIIIGTQLIAKGHHFPNLTLVGVIDGDIGVEAVDLRATERMYQLLHQLSGRAGRGAKKGEVFIQTYHPESPILQALESQDEESFINYEIQNRKLAQMPPFSKLAAIIISDKNAEIAKDTASLIGKKFANDNALECMGPITAPIYFLRNKYRHRILLKSSQQNLQQNIIRNIAGLKIANSTQVKIDIDPYNFF
jgi:primosomal protein N' (replication factor Y) (superfamily II helicase)